MPRRCPIPKKDALKAQLADRLRLPEADILTRIEVAKQFGRHLKTISNGGSQWPGFYLANLGRNGWALYRRDWVDGFDQGARVPEGPQPWPPAPTSRESMDALLDYLKITDADYRAELHGTPSSEP